MLRLQQPQHFACLHQSYISVLHCRNHGEASTSRSCWACAAMRSIIAFCNHPCPRRLWRQGGGGGRRPTAPPSASAALTCRANAIGPCRNRHRGQAHCRHLTAVLALAGEPGPRPTWASTARAGAAGPASSVRVILPATSAWRQSRAAGSHDGGASPTCGSTGDCRGPLQGYPWAGGARRRGQRAQRRSLRQLHDALPNWQRPPGASGHSACGRVMLWALSARAGAVQGGASALA